MFKVNSQRVLVLVALIISMLAITFSALATNQSEEDHAVCTYTYTTTLYNNNDVEVSAYAYISFFNTDNEFIGVFPSDVSIIAIGETITLEVSTVQEASFTQYYRYYSWQDNYNHDRTYLNVLSEQDTVDCDNNAGGDDNNAGGDDNNAGGDDNNAGGDDNNAGGETVASVAQSSPIAPSSAQLGRVIFTSVQEGGFTLWTLNSSGQLQVALDLNPTFLASLPSAPAKNTEYASSEDGSIRFYVLNTGEYQLNFGPDFEGKVRAIVFTKDFQVTNRYEFRVGR